MSCTFSSVRERTGSVHSRRRGSIPDPKNKPEGYWATFGTDQETLQPIVTCEWIDRLAAESVGGDGSRDMRYLQRDSRDGRESDGAMELADYLGWDWKSKDGIPLVCIPRMSDSARQFDGDIAIPAAHGGAACADDSLDDALRPTWLFGQTVHEGCDQGGYYEQAEFAEEYGAKTCIVKLGCWGQWCQYSQRWKTRMDVGNRRVSERRQNLHQLHDAEFSG